jgi:hypothetical protein
MEQTDFDALTRSLAGVEWSRRRGLRALGGAILATISGAIGIETMAAKGRSKDKHRRNNKREGIAGNRRPRVRQSNDRDAAVGASAKACLASGGKCKRSAQCCSGSCLKRKKGKKRRGVCAESCTPQCASRVCGGNGCGGSCGSCPAGQFCDANGQCRGCPAGQRFCGGACVSGNQCCPGETRSCYTGPAGTLGKGICAAGTERCLDNGQWGGCLGQVLPTCDGRACGPDRCGGSCGTCPSGLHCHSDGQCSSCPDGQKLCRGACILKTQCCTGLDCGTGTCQNGLCVCPPNSLQCGPDCIAAAACCPGETRTCYSGPAGSAGKGICKAGTQTCAANFAWGACQGEVLPKPETCNGVDDDCDGVIDDGPLCPGEAVCRSGGCCLPIGTDCENVDEPCCDGRSCGPLGTGGPRVCK